MIVYVSLGIASGFPAKTLLYPVKLVGKKNGEWQVVTVNGADETKAAEALESFLKANL